jgi:SprT protein
MQQIDTFESLVPLGAAAYCKRLQEMYAFDCYLARSRKGRLGDFTIKQGMTPKITVNVDLNRYNFLITYLHEVAHCIVYSKYKKKRTTSILPHGLEWKNEFRLLLLPVMNVEFFPDDILPHLLNYAQKPKASTSGDEHLYASLKRYDDRASMDDKIALEHLPEGVTFVFQKRKFTKGAVRRTRVLCVDNSNLRTYTIPLHALVEKD